MFNRIIFHNPIIHLAQVINTKKIIQQILVLLICLEEVIKREVWQASLVRIELVILGAYQSQNLKLKKFKLIRQSRRRVLVMLEIMGAWVRDSSVKGMILKKSALLVMVKLISEKGMLKINLGIQELVCMPALKTK